MLDNLQLNKQLKWENFTIVGNLECNKWFKLNSQFDVPWGRD